MSKCNAGVFYAKFSRNKWINLDASNRNEYQKHKNNNVSGECRGCVGLSTVADYLYNVWSLTSHNPIDLQGLLLGWLYFTYFIY
jgi:hypothetical protein